MLKRCPPGCWRCYDSNRIRSKSRCLERSPTERTDNHRCKTRGIGGWRRREAIWRCSRRIIVETCRSPHKAIWDGCREWTCPCRSIVGRLVSPWLGGYDSNTFLGLGFDEADQHKPTKSFSGGWRYVTWTLHCVILTLIYRMRLALARALFVKVCWINDTRRTPINVLHR